MAQQGQASPAMATMATQRTQVKPFILIYLNNHARMAKSADAADLKSAGRKAVGVQVPLWAPLESIIYIIFTDCRLSLSSAWCHSRCGRFRQVLEPAELD